MREEGVEFRSHIDGSKHLFTPERVMDIERTIGADIMMAFDECTPGTADYEYAKKSMQLTHRWLDRCIKHFNETDPKYGYQQSLFPIVQGCVYPDLRKQSAEYIASKGADGNAIGGLAVGEPTEKMYEMIEVVNEILPKDKPRYLMGVGTPVNILEGIERGVKMFFTLTYQPGFFAKCDYIETAKEKLPQKVWKECVYCPQYPYCNELAFVKTTVDYEPGDIMF